MNLSETRRLESSIDSLSRFLSWIKSPAVELCVRNAPPGIAYTNSQGVSLQTLCKDAGSPLQFAENALASLRSLSKTRGYQALQDKAWAESVENTPSPSPEQV